MTDTDHELICPLFLAAVKASGKNGTSGAVLCLKEQCARYIWAWVYDGDGTCTWRQTCADAVTK